MDTWRCPSRLTNDMLRFQIRSRPPDLASNCATARLVKEIMEDLSGMLLLISQPVEEALAGGKHFCWMLWAQLHTWQPTVQSLCSWILLQPFNSCVVQLQGCSRRWRDLSGTVLVVIQPAEEARGGGNLIMDSRILLIR